MTCVKIEVKSQRRYAQSQLNSSCPQTNNKIYIKTWVKYFIQCVKWTLKSVCVLCCDVLYTWLRIQYIWLLQMNPFFLLLFHISLDYAFTYRRQQKHICAIWRCDCHNNALNGLQCTSAVCLKIYFSNHQLFHWSTVIFSSQMSPPEQMLILHSGLFEPGDAHVHIHWGVLGQDIIPRWDAILNEEKMKQMKE